MILESFKGVPVSYTLLSLIDTTLTLAYINEITLAITQFGTIHIGMGLI